MEKQMQELLNELNINRAHRNKIKEVFGDRPAITPDVLYFLYMSDPSVFECVNNSILEYAMRTSKNNN